MYKTILKFTLVCCLVFVSKVSAFEYEKLTDNFTKNVTNRVIDILVNDTIQTDTVTIHTDTAKQRKKFTKCWEKLVYSGDGIPRVRIICY